MESGQREGEAGAALLVVCTANVCRSPLAQSILDHGLRRTSLSSVRVSSAGTRADAGATMCTVSARLLPVDDQAEAFSLGHRARPATRDLVGEAALVITMEREQRSALVRLAPGSQAKVFTLREAVALGEALVEQRRVVPADLGEIAAALHSVRGLVAMPTPVEPRRWFRRAVEPPDALTIADGHGGSSREHLQAAETVRGSAQALIQVLGQLTGTRSASG